jgi:hypothetical protein
MEWLNMSYFYGLRYLQVMANRKSVTHKRRIKRSAAFLRSRGVLKLANISFEYKNLPQKQKDDESVRKNRYKLEHKNKDVNSHIVLIWKLKHIL